MHVLPDSNLQLKLMNKMYKFKIFKKTTKFRKYDRGLSRFIINRKKYIVRKKRTSLQLTFNSTFFWTKYYMSLRHYARFTQALNTCSYHLTLPNKQFTKRVSMKNMTELSSDSVDLHYSFATIKKKILWNNSLYIPKSAHGLNPSSSNSTVGLVLFNDDFSKVDKVLNFGLITDFSNNYSCQLNSVKPVFLETHNLFKKRLFLLTLSTAKAFRKILILSTLISIKK